MGVLKPTDAVEDVMDVLDFTRRLNLAYHRSEAHIFPSDGSYKAQIHTARQTAVLRRRARSASPPATSCTPRSRSSWRRSPPTGSSATASAG